MPPGGTTENENIPPSKGGQRSRKGSRGGCLCRMRRGSCDRDTPQRLRRFSPLDKGDFNKSSEAFRVLGKCGYTPPLPSQL